MTTKQTVATKVREWAWAIGILAGIAGASGFQWVTGGTRLTAVEARVAVLEASANGNEPILKALALDLCLRTTDPRIRAPLECFRRENGK